MFTLFCDKCTMVIANIQTQEDAIGVTSSYEGMSLTINLEKLNLSYGTLNLVQNPVRGRRIFCKDCKKSFDSMLNDF